MQAVFMGTPASAGPSLRALAEIAEVRAVVTRPDRPRGRSKAPKPSAIKLVAEELGLPILQPVHRRELHESLAPLAPFEVGVVVAFGMIIPGDVLELAEHGFVNVHFSLLPRWRGAAPVQRAIAEGDSVTGVTLMKMDEGLDTGPIIDDIETSVEPDDTAGTLTGRLAELGAGLLRRDLEKYIAGGLRTRSQSAIGVTYAAKVLPEEARLDVSDPQDRLLAMIRAFNPKPGAFVRHAGARLKVWAARPHSGSLEAGALAMVDDDLVMGTGSDPVELIEVQSAGKRRMSGADWARGRRGSLGHAT